MSDLEPKDSQQRPLKPAWLNQHRLLSAILLHGLWKLRWYQTVFILWPMLLAAAWGASPYFMVYVVGMPEPGTAPRYVGTVRVEGELQRTKSGWKQPSYFIKTSNGDVQFHCGYQPDPTGCGEFYNFPKIYPKMIYEIGYDQYWGIDYIKYPDSVPPRLQQNSLTETITYGRLLSLKLHNRQAAWFACLFLTYLYLMWLAYQKSNPTKLPYPHAKPYPFEPDAPTMDIQAKAKLSKPKSFFD